MMASLGLKKKRPYRTPALRAGLSVASRADELLAERGAVLRVFLCLFSVLALLFAVEGWKSPFVYRLGDRSESGVTAIVDFHRVNPDKTAQAKANSEAQVPYTFQHDPTSLNLLSARLRTDLGEVAQANSVEELSPETRTAFGLTLVEPAGGAQGRSRDDVNRSFDILHAVVSMEDSSAGNRIDVLEAEFDQFIAPLKVHGLADPAELTANAIRPDRPVLVVSRNDPQRSEQIPLADVRLNDVLKDTGRLGKQWQQFPELVAIRQFVERWLQVQAPVTLRYDSSATQEARRAARDRIQPVTDDYIRGDLLVGPGQTIDASSLAVLQAQHNELVKQATWTECSVRAAVVFLLLSVLAALNAYYLVHNEPQMIRRLGRLGLFLVVVIAAVVLGRLLSFDPWRAEIIPLTATVMVFAIAYDRDVALLTAFSMALIIALSTTTDIGQFVVMIGVSAVAVIPLTRVASRSRLLKVGFLTAAAYFMVSMWIGILDGTAYASSWWSDTDLLVKSLRGAGLCLLSCTFVVGSLPFIESAFGVVTNISLLEMSDISHPLLQELVRRAPGTYNHSIAVATIGESAADRIHANGLLVRVGAYFHDIGKMLKPDYFVENMTEGKQSRHEHLAPAMSTLIIIGHVKDGVDLARQHNLPQALVDFIEQHHGTTLVEYFYHEATRQADLQPDHKTDAEESSFRYPGPKPQTREAGVLMLSDAVESASRTLSEPTPKRIERLVHEITMKRLLDGQFEECALTLSEIRAIEDSLTKSLIGIYHGRIKYPEQRTA